VPVMIKDGRSVLFIHIPKTGGTSVERLFKKSGWEQHLHERRQDQPVLFPLLRCAPQHYHAALLAEMFDVTKFDLTVAIVRDPVARFRSEFAHRNAKVEPVDIDAERVTKWGKRILGRYQANNYHFDNHMRPQTEFLLPGTEVYRLEDGIPEMIADLNTRFDLGLRTTVKHHLKSDQRGLSSSSVEVSPELRTLLHEVYAEDFSRLDYPTT
jgi:hypothetical protein